MKFFKKIDKNSVQSWLVILLIFASLFLVLQRFNKHYAKSIPIIGDEPSYMAIADSLVAFKTFNLYQEEETHHYKDFFYKIKIHTVDVEPGKSYPKHGIAWPLLFTPFFFLQSNPRLLIMLLQNFIVVLLTLNVFLWLKENKYSFWLSLFVPLTLLFTIPISMQTYQVFSEPLAALFLVYAFRKIEKPNFLSILALAILPWIHIKYMAFLPVFALPLLKINWKNFKKTKVRKVWPFILVGISIIGLAIFNYHAYNTIFSGQERAEYFFGTFQGLLGIFANRENGLFASAPIYIAAFLGLGALYAKNRKLFWPIVYCAVIMWLITGVFHNWDGGQAATGRMILVTFPILAPALAEVLIMPFKWFFRIFYAILLVPSMILGILAILQPMKAINKDLFPGLNVIPETLGLPLDLEKYFPGTHLLGWNYNLMWLLVILGFPILGYIIIKNKKVLEKFDETLNRYPRI